MKKHIFSFIFILFILGSPGCDDNGDDHVSDPVATIDWWRFDPAVQPDDDDAVRSRDLLLNAMKYGLSWVETLATADDGFYDFGGTSENSIRPPASEAMALAVTLKTGIYDAGITGVSENDAMARTVKLIGSLAYRHMATSEGGWGNHWQSALWAGLAGQAGWMMYADLDTDSRDWLTEMVVYEANRFIDYAVPYYRDRAGNINRPGNTAGEENSWDSMILQLATAMLPNHTNIESWRLKLCELMIAAYARPSDVDSSSLFDGWPLSAWLNGSNIEEDGAMINHGRIHPDYMTCFTMNLRSHLIFSLAEMNVPKSANFNVRIIYDALVDLEFATPPYLDPGGTIYIDGSESIYYPEDTDWSRHRFDVYYLADVFTHILELDDGASTGGLTWERLRVHRMLDMQARHYDSRLYADGEFDSYQGREQLAAWQFADAYLLKWLVAQDQLSPTSNWDISE